MPNFIIDLFYDIVSPYSFIAFTQLRAYQPLWGFTLRLQPVFQGAVMKGSGNTRQ
jgi:glutathione S-transferase kappa 1